MIYLFAAGLGFFTLGTQILLAREVLATFFGTELVLSAFYTAWLASFGMGAWLLRRRGGATALHAMTVVVIVAAPWAVAFIRYSPGLLRLAPGESMPLWASILAPVAALFPLGVAAGTLFPLGARVVGEPAKVGRFYAAEAAGGLAAGIAATAALGRADTFHALLPFTAAFAATVVALRRTLPRRLLGQLALAAALAHSLVWSARGPALEHARWRALVGEGALTWSGDSHYGHLQVARAEDRSAFYFDGTLLFSCPPDPLELLEAKTMLLLPRSLRRVVVAGHPSPPVAAVAPETTEVRTVQEDPLLAAVASRRCLSPRGTIASPRSWLAGQREVDLLLVYAPAPTTAVANRLYTREFFRSVRRCLAPGGVLAVPAHLPAALLSGVQVSAAAGVFQDLAQVFPYVVVSPGPGGWFFASSEAGFAPAVARKRAARRDDGGLSAAYVDLMFPSAETEEVTRTCSLHPPVPPNTDRHPRAYARQLQVWMRRAGFHSGSRLNARWLRAAAAAGLGAAVLWVWRRRKRRASRTTSSIATTGFVSFAGSLLVLMGFQHAAGTLYHQIAMLQGCYMAGLAAGAWFGTRRRVGLLATDCALAATLAAGMALVPVARTPACYYAITVAIAAASGMQFAQAAPLVGAEGNAQLAAGTLEWFDRLGACAGGLAVGLLLPLSGFVGAFLVLVVIKLVSAAANARSDSPFGAVGHTE